MLLGTGVYVASLTHPVQLAEEIATLDQLSGGRFVFGAGIGYRDEEFDSFGIDRRHRAPRFLEALEVIRGLWGDEPFTFHGDHFRIEGQRSSVQPFHRDRVPFWIGANTPATIQRAARIGDGWLASPNVKLNFAAGNLQAFRDEWAAQGKPPGAHHAPIARELHLADTDDEARRRADEYLRTEYIEYSQYDLDHFVDLYDDLMAKSFLVGSPATVTERIGRYRDAGFDTMLFRTFWSGMPYEMAFETLERFAAEVMPHFADDRPATTDQENH